MALQPLLCFVGGICGFFVDLGVKGSVWKCRDETSWWLSHRIYGWHLEEQCVEGRAIDLAERDKVDYFHEVKRIIGYA